MTARWMHFSDAESVTVTSVEQSLRNRRDKPAGFWISDESRDDGWSHWAAGEEWTIGSNAFAVELAAAANVLWLEDVESVVGFHDTFTTAGSRGWGIDWPSVAEQWQGIVITPYQWPLRLSSHVSWYYGWDCASGCVWDASAIAAVTPASVGASA